MKCNCAGICESKIHERNEKCNCAGRCESKIYETYISRKRKEKMNSLYISLRLLCLRFEVRIFDLGECWNGNQILRTRVIWDPFGIPNPE